MTDRTISPLRRRMTEDMTVRGFTADTQRGYIAAVKRFTAFLGRSPDQATAEDLRRFQFQMRVQGASPTTMNAAVSALRFLFGVSLARSDAEVAMTTVRDLRATLSRIFPRAGDNLVTNRRRPILYFAEDTSPGLHDTLMAACDDYRYGLLNCTGYHDNCTDNLFAAMRRIGLTPPGCPSPFNMWMNIPVAAEGSTEWGVPLSQPGDYVVLRAEMDCVVAMSACPQDILPINGEARDPTEAHYRILG